MCQYIVPILWSSVSPEINSCTWQNPSMNNWVPTVVLIAQLSPLLEVDSSLPCSAIVGSEDCICGHHDAPESAWPLECSSQRCESNRSSESWRFLQKNRLSFLSLWTFPGHFFRVVSARESFHRDDRQVPFSLSSLSVGGFPHMVWGNFRSWPKSVLRHPRSDFSRAEEVLLCMTPSSCSTVSDRTFAILMVRQQQFFSCVAKCRVIIGHRSANSAYWLISATWRSLSSPFPTGLVLVLHEAHHVLVLPPVSTYRCMCRVAISDTNFPFIPISTSSTLPVDSSRCFTSRLPFFCYVFNLPFLDITASVGVCHDSAALPNASTGVLTVNWHSCQETVPHRWVPFLSASPAPRWIVLLMRSLDIVTSCELIAFSRVPNSLLTLILENHHLHVTHLCLILHLNGHVVVDHRIWTSHFICRATSDDRICTWACHYAGYADDKNIDRPSDGLTSDLVVVNLLTCAVDQLWYQTRCSPPEPAVLNLRHRHRIVHPHVTLLKQRTSCSTDAVQPHSLMHFDCIFLWPDWLRKLTISLSRCEFPYCIHPSNHSWSRLCLFIRRRNYERLQTSRTSIDVCCFHRGLLPFRSGDWLSRRVMDGSVQFVVSRCSLAFLLRGLVSERTTRYTCCTLPEENTSMRCWVAVKVCSAEFFHYLAHAVAFYEVRHWWWGLDSDLCQH